MLSVCHVLMHISLCAQCKYVLSWWLCVCSALRGQLSSSVPVSYFDCIVQIIMAHGRPGPLQVNFDKGMQFTVLWTLLTKMDTCPWTVNLSWAAMMNP